jgi:hypothetical protein
MKSTGSTKDEVLKRRERGGFLNARERRQVSSSQRELMWRGEGVFIP